MILKKHLLIPVQVINYQEMILLYGIWQCHIVVTVWHINVIILRPASLDDNWDMTLIQYNQVIVSQIKVNLKAPSM